MEMFSVDGSTIVMIERESAQQPTWARECRFNCIRTTVVQYITVQYSDFPHLLWLLTNV
jgi:hypothetical protein